MPREIHQPTPRYRVIDQQALHALFGFSSMPAFQQIYCQWVAAELKADTTQRQPCWTESLAVEKGIRSGYPGPTGGKRHGQSGHRRCGTLYAEGTASLLHRLFRAEKHPVKPRKQLYLER